MSINNLSDKQKANRAYYAANADQIREKKRQQYFLKIAKHKKKPVKPIKRNPPFLNPERPIEETRKVTKEPKKQSTRSKIEDYQTFKEIEQWF